MKRSIVIILLAFIGTAIRAQVKLPSYPDSIFSTYYQQRFTHFLTLQKTKDDIIFLGNSITDGAEWDELFADSHIKNRGISGDITAGVINRLGEIIARKPAKVFLLIGVNDLARNTSPDSIVKNIGFIAAYIHQQTPSTRLYIQSLLPVNSIYKKFPTHTNKSDQINIINNLLMQNARTGNYTFINIHTAFCDKDGKMKASLTNDGLHLKGEGYLLWKHLIYQYAFDLENKPALLPTPQSVKWNNGFFPAYKCGPVIAGDKLNKERDYLQNLLSAMGVPSIKNTMGAYPIELRLARVEAPQLADEAYRLQVDSNRVLITANSAHGIFNAIQTLRQLLRDSTMIDACDITDWPAFAWRGYMIDAGRNFQSVEQIEQQIDKMALYKLNVFHLHLTEDVAWRLFISKYPQLTAAGNMMRNKGMYYTPENIRELINYCSERHITFVPEIDMPGHSAAFKRAMKTDMQSDSGIYLLKNIIREFCSAYPQIKYLHIGGDEVKITNKVFLPEMENYIHQLGKTAIAWEPGGNNIPGTIRQLWMKSGPDDDQLKYIDSRNLYLNHMDPLESVVAIFNRKIGGEEKGNGSLLGGEICLWNDRAVWNEHDLLRMNPVYPAMLAFAERSWCGGGVSKQWLSFIPNSQASQFSAFEKKLLDNKAEYFKGMPFPYYRQSNIHWKVYGPYNNGGNLAEKFEPENKNFNAGQVAPVASVTGGTIILRHWWYPAVQGVIDNPKENTTYYAVAKIWSDEDKLQDCWIGFNNISRSTATDSPQPLTWDNHYSCIWVNGELVPPPLWQHAGQAGNEEMPLIDEGYEYRRPTKIVLKKGWNSILVKVPIGSFKGKNYQNPEKWMFTFMPLNSRIE